MTRKRERFGEAPVIPEKKKADCLATVGSLSSIGRLSLHSPKYAALTFGSSSMTFASPDIVTVPESIT